MSSIKTVYQGEIRRFRLDESKPFADLRAQFVKLYKLNEGCELLCKYQDDESEWVTVTSDVELIEAMRLCSQAACLKLHVAVDGAPQSAPAIAPTTAPTAPKVVEEDKKAKSALPPTPLPSSPSQEALEKKRMIKEKQQIRFAASASPQVQAMVQDLLHANRHMVDSFATVTVENEDGEPVALVDNNNEAEGEEAATTNATGAAVHHGVACDMCGVDPIVGVRFKCKTCHNFDLCEACEAKEVYSTSHVLLKIRSAIRRHGRWFHGLRRHGHCHARGGDSQFKAEFVETADCKQDKSVKINGLLEQVWSVKNVGEVAWPEGCNLQFHNGRLSFADRTKPVAIPAARPNETVQIRAVLTVTSEAPRRRVAGKFVMVTAEGARFGPLLWACANIDNEAAINTKEAVVAVVEPSPVSAAPAPSPSPVPAPASAVPLKSEKVEAKLLPVPANFPYSAQLAELEGIFGKTRREALLELLLTSKGNIQQVAEWMLSPGNSAK